MHQIIGFVLPLLLLSVAIAAAPVPPIPDARLLVAGLSAPDEKARDEAVIALRNRSDATPWLRRASRSTDRDAARRATALLAHVDGARQDSVPRAIDACIRDGSADLFVEWHQFWKPKAQDDLWPVGPRMGRAALSEFAKRWPDEKTNHLEDAIASMYFPGHTCTYHDGPQPERFGSTLWHVRTDRLKTDGGGTAIAFASVAGATEIRQIRYGYYFSLGQLGAKNMLNAVAICDSGAQRVFTQSYPLDSPSTVQVSGSYFVCRGDANLHSAIVTSSVLLVDGDIDMRDRADLKDSLIRASGQIHLPKNCTPQNCVIEAHVKNATEPYKFFALSDLGLSVADDEEGLVVTGVKPGTPFGDSGLTKGDLIKAIDDAPAGHSESFRAPVRRALVRQGDCLLTVTRGDKSYDLPVFFPLPK